MTIFTRNITHIILSTILILILVNIFGNYYLAYVAVCYLEIAVLSDNRK